MNSKFKITEEVMTQLGLTELQALTLAGDQLELKDWTLKGISSQVVKELIAEGKIHGCIHREEFYYLSRLGAQQIPFVKPGASARLIIYASVNEQ